MNKVNVLFFATLKEKAGTASGVLELPEGTNVATFKQLLFQRFPNLPRHTSSLLVAVNKEYAFDQEEIPNGAEVALFPPVSGGAGFPTILLVTEDALDIDLLLGQVTLPTTGAACFFSGMVRGVTEGGEAHKTLHLVYEAYVSMAERKLRQVADEIRSRWPLVEGICIVQRVGKLMPGTPTVLIACSAAHRDTGIFEAARYGIDRLKEIVPVWKKEVSTQGEEWVEGDYVPNPAD